MIVNRCRSPVRDFLGSSKHPPRRMSAATPPFLGSHTNIKRAGDVSKWITARRRSAQSAAEMSARSHANGAAPQCHLHVISILNAAPPNAVLTGFRQCVPTSPLLPDAPGENE